MNAWVTATNDDLLMPATASYLAKPSTRQQHDAIKKYQPVPTVTPGSRQAPRSRAICRVLQSKFSHQTRDRHLTLRIAHTAVQWLLAQIFGRKPIEAWLLISPSVSHMRLGFVVTWAESSLQHFLLGVKGYNLSVTGDLATGAACNSVGPRWLWHKESSPSSSLSFGMTMRVSTETRNASMASAACI